MQESQSSEATLKEEIRSLKKSLNRLDQQFTALKEENEELRTQAEISKTEVHIMCTCTCIYSMVQNYKTYRPHTIHLRF